MTNPEFPDIVILENSRAILRPLESSDFENLKIFSLTEPEIWKYSSLHAIGELGLKNYINLSREARAAKKEYAFIVFDKLHNRYAGCTRYYDIQLSNNSLLIGFTWYGIQFQGTGLNKHCKFLLLEYAFEIMGIERVEFRADKDNTKSIAAMKSIGCIPEGILRSNGFKPDGNRRDSIVLSILKDEWYNSVKGNLRNQIELQIAST